MPLSGEDLYNQSAIRRIIVHDKMVDMAEYRGTCLTTTINSVCGRTGVRLPSARMANRLPLPAGDPRPGAGGRS